MGRQDMDDREEGARVSPISAVGSRGRAVLRLLSAQSVIILFSIFALIMTTGPHLAAQPALPDLSQVRLIAVAPFVDEAGLHEDLTRWAATRLAAFLSSRGVHLVPVTQVELALRETGLRPTD